MNLSVLGGAFGTVWMIVCAPQAVFNVYLRNELGATSAQLGILVALLNLASVLQLAGIGIYRRLPRRKPFWIATSLVHRLNGPVLAVVAFSVAAGGSRGQGIAVIFIAMVASWIITNLSSSGWWSWMADLVPIGIRARFFGKRSAVAQVVNIASFFTVTVALDAATGDARLVVYGIVFAIAGLAGLVDILVHLFIPEPRDTDPSKASAEAPPVETAADRACRVPSEVAGRKSEAPSAEGSAGIPRRGEFTAPVRDANFLRFALITGLVLFSINISAPFFAPYVTDPTAIGAPNTWLGIMFVISQSIWVAVAPGWGTIMDRFGRKPAVMIGLLFTVSWIGYVVLSPSNYVIVLPLIAMVGGVLAPAFWDGINQLMLSLTPENRRLTYIAWYWAIIGIVASGGSYVGGALDDALRGRRIPIGSLEVAGFHVVVLASLAMVAVSLLALSRVQEGPSKPMSFVFTRVATPGIFKTFLNIGTLTRSSTSEQIVKALRSIDSVTDDLAADQVLARIHDPDPEVREEAVRALGRLRSAEATDALLGLLSDPGATTRLEAARALGKIGDSRAIPHLIKAMEAASEEMRQTCVLALGEIGGEEPVALLKKILQADSSDAVAASSATAVSHLGELEAAWEIVGRLHRTGNPILRTQLAIALGNLLGRPGEFYRFVTGQPEQQATAIRRLVIEAEKAYAALYGSPLPAPIASGLRSPRADWHALLAELDVAAKQHVRFASRTTPQGAGRQGDELHDHQRQIEEQEARLSLWRWFVTTSASLPDNAPENARLELVVALYMLRTLGR